MTDGIWLEPDLIFSEQNQHFEIPQNVSKINIDVGLSLNAPQSQVWLENDPELFVIGFEPLVSNIENIKTGKSIWPINLNPKFIGKRILIIQCALSCGDTPRKQSFYVTANDPGCSSLLEPRFFDLREIDEVNVYKLDDFYERFPFERFPKIHFLKIDTQGSDYEVLLGAKKFLRHVSAVTVEVDMNGYIGTRNSFENIYQFLRPYGFTFARKGILGSLLRKMKGIHVDIQTDDPTFIKEQDFKIKSKVRPILYQRG